VNYVPFWVVKNVAEYLKKDKTTKNIEYIGRVLYLYNDFRDFVYHASYYDYDNKKSFEEYHEVVSKLFIKVLYESFRNEYDPSEYFDEINKIIFIIRKLQEYIDSDDFFDEITIMSSKHNNISPLKFFNLLNKFKYKLTRMSDIIDDGYYIIYTIRIDLVTYEISVINIIFWEKIYAKI